MSKLKLSVIITLNLIVLTWGLSLGWKNYQLNQARENLKTSAMFLHLQSKIKTWSDNYELTVPQLEFRFNHSNEGFYNPQLAQITILTSMEDWQNQEFLEAVLAHEFGHHYISFKMGDLPPEDAELAADFIAKDLVGLENYIKALTKGLDRPVDGTHLTVNKRIEILNQYPDNHILDKY